MTPRKAPRTTRGSFRTKSASRADRSSAPRDRDCPLARARGSTSCAHCVDRALRVSEGTRGQGNTLAERTSGKSTGSLRGSGVQKRPAAASAPKNTSSGRSPVHDRDGRGRGRKPNRLGCPGQATHFLREPCHRRGCSLGNRSSARVFGKHTELCRSSQWVNRESCAKQRSFFHHLQAL